MEVKQAVGRAAMGRARRMKRVVLSCTPSSTYDFFLPISVELWRNRIGYEPVVLLVGTKAQWSVGHCGAVLDEILDSGCKIEWVDHVPGVSDANVSMAARQHAPALSWLDPTDVVLIGDIDLFPIRKDYYHQHDPMEAPITIYHADMYNDYWPAYGPSMSVEVWRNVMGLIVGDLMGSLLKTFREGKIKDLIAANKADHRDSRLWIFDEQYTSTRIKGSEFFNSVLWITGHTNDRICRNKWPADLNVQKYIDCHCPRPGWTDENFKKIRAVIAQVLPEELPWLDQYVAIYRATNPMLNNPFA